MWEQGEQITVAFANCHHLCSPSSAHDYVWPLLIDKPPASATERDTKSREPP
jgi:hypothetical protein